MKNTPKPRYTFRVYSNAIAVSQTPAPDAHRMADLVAQLRREVPILAAFSGIDPERVRVVNATRRTYTNKNATR